MFFRKAPPCSRSMNPSFSSRSRSCRMVTSVTLNILLSSSTFACPSSRMSSRIFSLRWFGNIIYGFVWVMNVILSDSTLQIYIFFENTSESMAKKAVKTPRPDFSDSGAFFRVRAWKKEGKGTQTNVLFPRRECGRRGMRRMEKCRQVYERKPADISDLRMHLSRMRSGCP